MANLPLSGKKNLNVLEVLYHFMLSDNENIFHEITLWLFSQQLLSLLLTICHLPAVQQRHPYWAAHVKPLTSFSRAKTQWLLAASTRADLSNLSPPSFKCMATNKNWLIHTFTLDVRLSHPSSPPAGNI